MNVYTNNICDPIYMYMYNMERERTRLEYWVYLRIHYGKSREEKNVVSILCTHVYKWKNEKG
jgi:hypothetical protein